jgi:ribonuclease/clavin/mitogillin
MHRRLLPHIARHTTSLIPRLHSSIRLPLRLPLPLAPHRHYPVVRVMSSLPSALTPLPSVHRHSPRVWSILGQNPGPMTLQGTNTYLVGTGSHRLLVDTGEGVDAYTDLLRGVLNDQSVTNLTILLTHWHADHTAGVKSVCALFDAAHAPSIHKFSGSALLPKSVVDAYPELAHRVERIEDGQRFEVEGATLRAIHTPGHTADHCIFELAEEQAVMSGDTILGASTAVFDDLHAYMHSLRRIATCKPQRIYPAHGPIIDGVDAPQRVDQYLHHRTQRETQILQTMKEFEQQTTQVQTDKRYPTVMELVERICQWRDAHACTLRASVD